MLKRSVGDANLDPSVSVQTRQELHRWRIAQLTTGGAAVAVLGLLMAGGTLGRTLVWDLTVPLLPALIVLAPGLWRNVCPLSSLALLPRKLGLSRRRRLSYRWQSWLQCLAVILLLALIPLRHVVFNLDSQATFMLLLATGGFALLAGLLFDWKAAWCNGLCPVGAVERLYGRSTRRSVKNAHCRACSVCSAPCQDTQRTPALTQAGPQARRVGGALLTGAFPGYVWGWFQVADGGVAISFEDLWLLYQPSALGGVATLAVYLILRALLQRRDIRRLDRIYAALAISTYYWFRIPAWVGYGLYPGDGMLFDLTGTVSESFVQTLALLVGVVLGSLLVFQRIGGQAWQQRPALELPMGRVQR